MTKQFLDMSGVQMLAQLLVTHSDDLPLQLSCLRLLNKLLMFDGNLCDGSSVVISCSCRAGS